MKSASYLPDGKFDVVRSSYCYRPSYETRVFRCESGWVAGGKFQYEKPKRAEPTLKQPGFPPGVTIRIGTLKDGSRCFHCVGGQVDGRWERLHEPFAQGHQGMLFKVDQCHHDGNVFHVNIEFDLDGSMAFTTGTSLRLIVPKEDHHLESDASACNEQYIPRTVIFPSIKDDLESDARREALGSLADWDLPSE